MTSPQRPLDPPRSSQILGVNPDFQQLGLRENGKASIQHSQDEERLRKPATVVRITGMKASILQLWICVFPISLGM